MKFIDFFRKKENLVIDKEPIIALLNNQTRISYKNIYGDGESCNLSTFTREQRSTSDIKDITGIFLYDSSNTLKYIIRVESKKIVYCQEGYTKKGNYKDIKSIDKQFINELLDKIDLII